MRRRIRKVREKYKSEDVRTDMEDDSGEDTTKKSKRTEWLLIANVISCEPLDRKSFELFPDDNL